MLYRWLCDQGYEVIVEQQIAHELLKLKMCQPARWRVRQQADLAVVVGGDGNMRLAQSVRTLARWRHQCDWH